MEPEYLVPSPLDAQGKFEYMHGKVSLLGKVG